MYLLVLCLFQFFFLSEAHSILKEEDIAPNVVKFSEEIPYVVFLCENCESTDQKVTITYEKKYVEKISTLKLKLDENWSAKVLNSIEKTIETQYKFYNKKTWPPQFSFTLSFMREKDGLLVFVNKLSSKETKVKYVLFYKKQLILGNSPLEIEENFQESVLHLNKKDGVVLSIAKEVSDKQFFSILEIIKLFSKKSSSNIHPLNVDATGIFYRTEIVSAQVPFFIDRINKTASGLSARIQKENPDIVEIYKMK